MCLDCYPDRCFTYACKNASHRTAVSVPAWCCTEKEGSSRAFCPSSPQSFVPIWKLGSVSHTPQMLSSSLFSLSVIHHPAHASRRRITGELCLCSTPSPIYLLPFSILPSWGWQHTYFTLTQPSCPFCNSSLLIFPFCFLFCPFHPLLYYSPHALSPSQERWALYCTLLWHWKLHSLDLY